MSTKPHFLNVNQINSFEISCMIKTHTKHLKGEMTIAVICVFMFIMKSISCYFTGSWPNKVCSASDKHRSNCMDLAHSH